VVESVDEAAPAVQAVSNGTVPAVPTGQAVPAVVESVDEAAPAVQAVSNGTVPAVPTGQAVPAVVESVDEAAPEEQAVSNGTVPAVVESVVRKTRIAGIPSLGWIAICVIVIVVVSGIETPPVAPTGPGSQSVVLAGPQTPVDPGETLVQLLARLFAA
jgi:hypothetical protein